MIAAALALTLASSSFYAHPAWKPIAQPFIAARASPIFARANQDARRKASTVAKNKYGNRKGISVNEFGIDVDTSMKAVPNRKLDVLLLKSVDGLGEAGQLVSVSIPMFENALRPSRKAKLPSPAERAKLLATQIERAEKDVDSQEDSQSEDSQSGDSQSENSQGTPHEDSL